MNNITNQNEYPLAPNSYTAFDAVSLRNLVIQRLNDQGLFTDQNYIGSNLASIIDIISFAFNTLIFYLNKTSTESTFTEAQIYENINRIVKLLDYKPIGYQTSTLVFQASANNFFNQGNFTIPRYSYVTIGGVSFSFNEDISFKIPSSNTVTSLTELTNTKLLYQGVYRENPLYTASGVTNEVVPITVGTNVLIDHFNIDVYVYEADKAKWFQYSNVANLNTEQAFSRSFEKRLNQSSIYEITFGDGINGRKLASGDKVAIYALQSSGSVGVVGPNALSQNAIPVVYNTATFNELWNDVTVSEQYTPLTSAGFKNILFDNIVGSTIPVEAENADSIRINAPSNFKSQYRLVTQQDYQTFVATNFANFISDVKVFSNWDYTGKYLKYFNDIQVSPTEFRQIMLNQVLYSDACNFNNVYICVKPKTSQTSTLKYLLPAQKEAILSNIQSLKTLSTEVTFVDPIYKAVSFGVPTITNEVAASDADFSVLQIIKNPSTRRTDGSILNEVKTVISDFFNPSNSKIGDVFDYSVLLSNILSVNGVSKIRTVRSDTGDKYEGLSLFMWNPTFPTLDISHITSSPTVGEFEIVYFNNLSGLSSKLEVVTS